MAVREGAARVLGLGMLLSLTRCSQPSAPAPARSPCDGLAARQAGPVVRMGATSVSGRLDPREIQRVVRERFPDIRACYEGGLRTNANLRGRVAVRFVVGRDGEVYDLGNGGSDLPDDWVLVCVMKVFQRLKFPPPAWDGHRGIATVVYPIFFSPAATPNADNGCRAARTDSSAFSTSS